MYDLPLFPLDTVLFPGQPLRLHIFEERYKAMIGMCLSTNQPFGVTLAEMSRPGDPPEWGKIRPYRVACTAEIKTHQRLDDGRYFLTVVGRERVKINHVRKDRPYLVAEVEDYPIDWGAPERVRRGSQVLRHWVERYIATLQLGTDNRPELPHRADLVAYVAATLFPGLSMPDKQDLLEAQSLESLIDSLRTLYRREVPLKELLNSPPKDGFAGPFSLS
jgi:Lon protease-like protein